MLSIFKKLHRTRQQVFRGDVNGLTAGRHCINDEFKGMKHVTEETSIAELIKGAEEAEQILRTKVIQVQQMPNDHLSMSSLRLQSYVHAICC